MTASLIFDLFLLAGCALQVAVWWGWTGRQEVRRRNSIRPPIAVVISVVYFGCTILAITAFPSLDSSAHDFPAGLALIVGGNVALNLVWLSLRKRPGNLPIV